MIEEQSSNYNPDKFLEIIKDGSVSPGFFKANQFLINTYTENLKNLPDEEKMEFIKKLWAEHFHATLSKNVGSNYYTHITFFSEQDMMLFYMKWNY